MNAPVMLIMPALDELEPSAVNYISRSAEYFSDAFSFGHNPRSNTLVPVSKSQ
jgi:hypothetical protein